MSNYAEKKAKRFNRLEKAAENAVLFIKTAEQELGEDDHEELATQMNGGLSMAVVDAIQYLKDQLEYCLLYVDTSIYRYDEKEEEELNGE